MKTLLLFGLFFACALNTVYAQKIETKKVPVRDHVYRISNWDSGYGTQVWVERATDSLRYLDQCYKWDESMEIKYEQEKMKQLTIEYILPFIKQSEKDVIRQDMLGLTCIFNLNGDLQEFAIDFPQKLNIPMTIVDNLFNAILSSEIKCSYKKDHPGLKKARFIAYSRSYYLEELLKE